MNPGYSLHALARCAGLLTVGAMLMMSACSLPLPPAQNDPTRYYVLSAEPAAAAVAAPANAPIVRLRPIDLPSYLRDRPIVVRRGTNEIEFQEFARWGEPLEQGIARVLRQELLSHGAASAVQIGSLRPSEVLDAKFDVTVRILACEGLADDRVGFHAVWEVTAAGDNPAVVARGDYHPTDLRWTTRNNASLAAALSRGVAGLAGEIAAAFPKP